MRSWRKFFPSLVLVVATACPVFADEGVDFFEEKIRPVLVEHCYKCHSVDSEKLKGGLLLDSRESSIEGGDTGPAVVPGDLEKSLLIEAIRYQNPDMEMPPKKRLSAEVVADFEKWIAMGAPDPREKPEGSAAKSRNVLYDDEEAESHWAFQPIRNPEPPEIDDPWIKNPIDAFVLRKLNEAGLKPSPRADGHTLLRRLTYDLTGLPPREKPGTYEETIDKLLASEQYGVHWGRHWLDIARYSDHTGMRAAGTAPPSLYPHAWTYRDWVISAFNNDMPWETFVTAQIAGDQIGDPAGVGFCRVGKTFGQNLNDRTDDRIDAVTKGFLGLSVSCARCHDHKFDPVTQADYFALHGIFMSSEETEAMVRDTAGTPEHVEYMKARQAVIDEATDWARDKLNDFISDFVHQTADFLVGTEKLRDGELKDSVPELAARELELQAIIFESWMLAIKKWEKKKEPVMTPWFAFAKLTPANFSEKTPAILDAIEKGSIDGNPVDPLVAEKFAESEAPESLRDVAEIYENLWIEIEKEADRRYPMTELIVNLRSLQRRWIPEEYDRFATEPEPLQDPEKERLRQVMLGFDGPFGGPQMPPRMLLRAGAGDLRRRINSALSTAVEIDGIHPGAPEKAMTFQDLKKPVDSAIQIRGDAENLGEIVPRRFISFLSGENANHFENGSGRLELANAIVDPQNPLTARVIVNRVWQWHFGKGLVPDASDFGLRSEPPTHPELLDWLATWFVENGGSMKKLHRLILESNTWQQASLPRPDAIENDPENTLLWRMNPRQLRFEEVRDTLLVVADRLDQKTGGRPADPESDASRRSAYLFVNRYELPDMFQTFDFANPDFSTAERESSIVSQQALFFLNSPWVMKRADEVGAILAKAGADDKTRISKAFDRVFGRAPTPEELDAAQSYLAGFRSGITESEKWSRFAQAMLQANELVFVR